MAIKRRDLMAATAAALALPALLLHLGWQPLLVDEPIRALVSLEMHYSGQFFAPTLQGFPYYNKPPLFNWLLVSLYRLSGRTDEWIVRLPTVAALLLYCTAIWRVLRPRLGSRLAFTVALALSLVSFNKWLLVVKPTDLGEVAGPEEGLR